MATASTTRSNTSTIATPDYVLPVPGESSTFSIRGQRS
jgi:hypothetical protein